MSKSNLVCGSGDYFDERSKRGLALVRASDMLMGFGIGMAAGSFCVGCRREGDSISARFPYPASHHVIAALGPLIRMNAQQSVRRDRYLHKS